MSEPQISQNSFREESILSQQAPSESQSSKKGILANLFGRSTKVVSSDPISNSLRQKAWSFPIARAWWSYAPLPNLGKWIYSALFSEKENPSNLSQKSNNDNMRNSVVELVPESLDKTPTIRESVVDEPNRPTYGHIAEVLKALKSESPKEDEFIAGVPEALKSEPPKEDEFLGLPKSTNDLRTSITSTPTYPIGTEEESRLPENQISPFNAIATREEVQSDLISPLPTITGSSITTEKKPKQNYETFEAFALKLRKELQSFPSEIQTEVNVLFRSYRECLNNNNSKGAEEHLLSIINKLESSEKEELTKTIAKEKESISSITTAAVTRLFKTSPRGLLNQSPELDPRMTDLEKTYESFRKELSGL